MVIITAHVGRTCSKTVCSIIDFNEVHTLVITAVYSLDTTVRSNDVDGWVTSSDFGCTYGYRVGGGEPTDSRECSTGVGGVEKTLHDKVS